MTNAEVFGLNEELVRAFRFADGKGRSGNYELIQFCNEEFNLLRMPCPVCHYYKVRVLPTVQKDDKVNYHVVCEHPDCRYCSPIGKTEDEAIEKHNAFCTRIINTRGGAQ